jgi:hypothetical protein
MTQHMVDRSGPFLELSLAEMLERIKRAGTHTAPSPLKPKPPATPAKSLGDPTPEHLAKEPDDFDQQTMNPGNSYWAT